MIPAGAPATGLCAACRHHRWITNRRGSSFLMCRKSFADPRFLRYPPLPVIACAGFEAGVGDAAAEEEEGP